jgi:hypothetical protein
MLEDIEETDLDQSTVTLEEVAKHKSRMNRFIKEGLSTDQAFDLAERMFDRDREPVIDNRLCFECDHYKDLSCMCAKYEKKMEHLRFSLRQCPDFKLRGKK